MASNPDFVQYIADQCAGTGEITVKKMFGDYGIYCDGVIFGLEPCARIDGKPCRHPDKVRPSLEAFGFDISKTAKDLLGLEIKWSKGDLIPEYLTLVGGIFY